MHRPAVTVGESSVYHWPIPALAHVPSQRFPDVAPFAIERRGGWPGGFALPDRRSFGATEGSLHSPQFRRAVPPARRRNCRDRWGVRGETSPRPPEASGTREPAACGRGFFARYPLDGISLRPIEPRPAFPGDSDSADVAGLLDPSRAPIEPDLWRPVVDGLSRHDPPRNHDPCGVIRPDRSGPRAMASRFRERF